MIFFTHFYLFLNRVFRRIFRRIFSSINEFHYLTLKKHWRHWNKSNYVPEIERDNEKRQTWKMMTKTMISPAQAHSYRQPWWISISISKTSDKIEKVINWNLHIINLPNTRCDCVYTCRATQFPFRKLIWTPT